MGWALPFGCTHAMHAAGTLRSSSDGGSDEGRGAWNREETGASCRSWDAGGRSRGKGMGQQAADLTRGLILRSRGTVKKASPER